MDGLYRILERKRKSELCEKIEWKTPKLKHRGEKKKKITCQRSVGQYYLIHHACNLDPEG